MADISLNELSSLINQLIKIQGHLFEYLMKIEALARVAIGQDFLDYEQSITHAYFWTLLDMTSEAKCLNEKTTDILLKWC